MLLLIFGLVVAVFTVQMVNTFSTPQVIEPKDGRDGRDGAKGDKGDPGLDGKDGEDGFLQRIVYP